MRSALSPALPAVLLAALLLAGCQVERADAPSAPIVTVRDTTLRCGAFDIPPEATRAVPNPRQANPPEVDTAVASPPPEAAEAALGLIVPVEGVQADELADTFEEARSQGRVHNAIDILAPRGRPVLAAAPGEVLRLFESERGGRTIYVRVPGSAVHYYAHLDGYTPGLAAGQRVAQGDTLGFVGDSGNAPAGVTHLHFAIWIPDDPDWFWDGEPVNPYPLLRGEARPASPPASAP